LRICINRLKIPYQALVLAFRIVGLLCHPIPRWAGVRGKTASSHRGQSVQLLCLVEHRRLPNEKRGLTNGAKATAVTARRSNKMLGVDNAWLLHARPCEVGFRRGSVASADKGGCHRENIQELEWCLIILPESMVQSKTSRHALASEAAISCQQAKLGDDSCQFLSRWFCFSTLCCVL
jgi:hypothetical protein